LAFIVPSIFNFPHQLFAGGNIALDHHFFIIYEAHEASKWSIHAWSHRVSSIFILLAHLPELHPEIELIQFIVLANISR
jgi:hypothetical protein